MAAIEIGLSTFEVSFRPYWIAKVAPPKLGDVPDTGQKQFTLAYNYNLSKRTKLYAFYTKIDTDVSGADFSSIATGVRHNF